MQGGRRLQHERRRDVGAGPLRRLHRTLPRLCSRRRPFRPQPYHASWHSRSRSADQRRRDKRPNRRRLPDRQGKQLLRADCSPSSVQVRTSPCLPDGLGLAVVHANAVEISACRPSPPKMRPSSSSPRPRRLRRPIFPSASLQRRLRPPVPMPTQTLPSDPGLSSLLPHLLPPPALRLTPTKANPQTSPPGRPSPPPVRRHASVRDRILRRPSARPAPRSPPPYTPSPTTNPAPPQRTHLDRALPTAVSRKPYILTGMAGLASQ